MIHIVKEGSNNTVIIVLHGTGGNETDLFPIASFIDPQATLVGIRGNIEERGMLRYFARNNDGSFDLRSLAKETYELNTSIRGIIASNNFQDKKLVVLGYSNGANIMQSMMKEFDLPFDEIYLLHPSAVRSDEPFLNQKAKVFVTSGDNDPYISKEAFEDILSTLKEASIEVSDFRHQQGHALTQEELEKIKLHYNQ